MTQQDTEVQETRTVSVQKSPKVETGSPQKEYQTKKAIFRTYQIIWYILGVIEVVLAFRVLLKLLGANSYSGFTSFIYAFSNPFALPFSGILGTTSSLVMVLEWSTFIAMSVYAILAYGLVALFQMVKPTNQNEVEENVDNQ
jgi:glucan phosphoethanolaminetransferase (alkaline phosphatase superfamily)